MTMVRASASRDDISDLKSPAEIGTGVVDRRTRAVNPGFRHRLPSLECDLLDARDQLDGLAHGIFDLNASYLARS